MSYGVLTRGSIGVVLGHGQVDLVFMYDVINEAIIEC